MKRPSPWTVVWLVVLIAALLLAVAQPEDAWARVGGGQDYGRGGGGGGGGGGDGIPIDLIILLIQLAIDVPAIGVPLLVIVVGFVAYRAWSGSRGGRQVHRTHSSQVRVPVRSRSVSGLEALRGRDHGFSVPVLQDFLVLLHRRAHEALSTRQWTPLTPFVTDAARRMLGGAHKGVRSVSEVVVGGVALLKIEQRGGRDLLSVRFESTRLEALDDGSERRVFVRERWTLQRAADAASLAPETIQRLGCPSCGASIEVTPMGTCRNCDTAITQGQLQWQATAIEVLSKHFVVPPKVGLIAGGDEASVHEPSLLDADLAAQLRRLTARHPGLDLAGFRARVRTVYAELQAAWSAGRWGDARPFVTDTLYQSLRFWIERYTRHGLRNQLGDVELSKIEIVRVQVDAWTEAITVRIWGSMTDTVVNAAGEVVGGNPRVARRFSEYWTFLRAAGTDGTTKGSSLNCPSCGADLDRISQTGICGYCDSKITTGAFDWVLSRIDQPEAYR